MKLDADLDDVRLTLKPPGLAGTFLFFLPFAGAGTLFFSLGLGFLGQAAFGLLHAQPEEAGALGLMGGIFCLVGGIHAAIGWTNIAKPLLSLDATIRAHSVEVRKRIGPVTTWRLELPLADLDRVACNGTHLLFDTPTKNHWMRASAFDSEELAELAGMIDEAAREHAPGEAPEAIRRLVSKVDASP